MKFLSIALLLPSILFASECKVDGISDSPQKLSCYIQYQKKWERLNLLCDQGTYYLVWKNKSYIVENAYHEEVERGASPLVFLSEGLDLTVITKKSSSKARVNWEGRTLPGRCKG